MKKYLIISILFISLFGCRSKEKAVNRINEKILIEKIETLNQQISENFKSDSIANYGSSFLKTFEGIDIDFVQADSSKTITITTPDGKQTKIKGANVKVSKQKETTQSKDTSVVHLKKEANKTTNSESQSNENTEKKTTARNANTKIKGTSTWFWLWLVIALALIVVWRLKLFFFK